MPARKHAVLDNRLPSVYCDTFGLTADVSGIKVWVIPLQLGYTVDNIHNCVVPMGFRQFNYEVDTDDIPWCLRCLQRVELTDRSPPLHFCLVAQITDLDIDTDVVGHLGPPVVAGYEL
jgi:hypothetical protein